MIARQRWKTPVMFTWTTRSQSAGGNSRTGRTDDHGVVQEAINRVEPGDRSARSRLHRDQVPPARKGSLSTSVMPLTTSRCALAALVAIPKRQPCALPRER
jgi:hypothetical protein